MIDLTDVLGWGSCDVEFLDKKISEFNLDVDDIKSEIDSIGLNLADINGWIYCTFYLGAYNFLNKVQHYADINNIEFDKNDIEIEVFTNYLDSFLNGSILNSEVDIMDFSDENLSSFIDKVKGV